ncbi:hypothetical protein HY489_05360 [Candidatus Woesearchaeota archaeon]|nr:hypothetical protein [Candidatus Woesearchaeota archaeon]
MARCSFCKHTLEPATGTMYVKTDGTILYFCSMKCEKNLLKLSRVPRYTRWTKGFEKGTANGQQPTAKSKESIAKSQQPARLEKPAEKLQTTNNKPQTSAKEKK